MMSGAGLSDRPSWYLVQTKPKQEFRALENLENQRYVCYLPTLRRQHPRGSDLKICVEPLFARYLFIRLDSMSSNWSPIRSTRGVARMVSFGGRFATLPDACIETLQSAPQIVREPVFQHGERVAITSGPFAGLEGIYQMQDGEMRALVLVELMRQPRKLELAVELLRKVG
jgi:transcriptional antiterminator RfaH